MATLEITAPHDLHLHVRDGKDASIVDRRV